MVAFRESASDAVSCAVAMQRAVARLNDRDPLLGLAVRIGGSIGEASFEEDDWFGTPVVEAARLEAAARPHQILVSGLLLGMVGSRGGHTFTSVGELELRGLPDPVPASEVAWEPDPGLPSIPLPSGLDRSGLRFAGREGALDALQRAWVDARGGDARFVLIEGEAGIGKSRLAAEFAARIHADDTIVLFGRCEADRELPYQPFAEALRWYAPAARPDDLRKQLGSYGGDLAQLVPTLRTRVPELPDAPVSDADAQQTRLFDGVAQLLRGASERAPLMLVIDDLELASARTVAMLRHLLGAADSARLPVVGLAGASKADTPWDAVASELRSAPSSVRLEVLGLTSPDVRSLLESEAGASGAGVATLATRIHDETDGHPRFVAELIARLREAGSLEADAVAQAAETLSAGAEAVFEAACPYMGLRAFEPDDASLFFGREEAVAGLLGRLAGTRLLSVVGASGSGKSSLVRAGLVPALVGGALPGSGDWPVVLMTRGTAKPHAAHRYS